MKEGQAPDELLPASFCLKRYNFFSNLHKNRIDIRAGLCHSVIEFMKRFMKNRSVKLNKGEMRMKTAAAPKPVRRKSLGKRIADNWQPYVLLLIPVIITIVYKYGPMYGIQIAFRNYNPGLGIAGSPWVGWKWFERFFRAPNFDRMLWNTIKPSLYGLLWGFPVPIILSLLLNQLRFQKLKRTGGATNAGQLSVTAQCKDPAKLLSFYDLWYIGENVMQLQYAPIGVLRVLMDKESVELFINDGERVVTSPIPTPLDADGISFEADAPISVSVEAHHLG